MKVITCSLFSQIGMSSQALLRATLSHDGNRIYAGKLGRERKVRVSPDLLSRGYARILGNLDSRSCLLALDEASVAPDANGEQCLVAPQDVPGLAAAQPDGPWAHVMLYLPSDPIHALGIHFLEADEFLRRHVAEDLVVLGTGETALVNRTVYGAPRSDPKGFAGARQSLEKVSFDGRTVTCTIDGNTIIHHLRPRITFA